ncbi:MAG: hypothetical protein GX493_02165 [Firmicutes bacterium]|nr:hypothetical protein [Bacillota bacterium]
MDIANPGAMMERTFTWTDGLAWDGQCLRLDGVPQILLGASVFYFRLAREDWASRLAMVKAAGYNTIDVYFPWNFHEIAEGEWDFTGRKDAAYFLDLAQAVGLKVIARPGPYICSEWEGGGLPAWLIGRGSALRQNDPVYLEYVRRWFDRILPILASRQAPNGPVVLVQIENELDFFPCHDVPGYLEELYRMARERGITVPITACIGQGNMEAATGNLDRLWPTVNLYPPDNAPGLEEEVEAIAEKLRQRGLPLIITETGRSHFLLRRLLAGGAKGICAFLQVGGNNFGLYEAVNDWREPGAFLATASDFGGMIDSGGRVRPEYYHGRVFGLALGAMRDLLAASLPAPPGTVVSWNDRVGSPTKDGGYTVRVLRAPEGTIFVMPANLREVEESTRLNIGDLTVPRRARLVLPPYTMPIFPFHLDLRSRGVTLKLVYALSELVYMDRLGDTLVVVAHGPEGTAGELLLRGRVDLLYADEGISVRREGDEISLRYPHDRERFCHLETDSGRILFVLTSSRRAGRLWPLRDRDGRAWLLFGADYVNGDAGQYELKPGCEPLFLLGPGRPEEAVLCLRLGDLNWARLSVELGDVWQELELAPLSCEIGLVPGQSIPPPARLLPLGPPPLR